eukprot:gene49242-10626_t
MPGLTQQQPAAHEHTARPSWGHDPPVDLAAGSREGLTLTGRRARADVACAGGAYAAP